MTKIFLSYARIDLKHASRLYKELCNKTGHDVWFDKESLLPGARWKPAIRKAIRDSRFFVGIFSKRSVSSQGYRNSELREAMEVLEDYPDNKVYAIPVRLDDCRMPDDRLNELHQLDLFPNWADGVANLCRVLGTAKRKPADKLLSPVPQPDQYRVALLDLDLKLPKLSHLAKQLNACQSFFNFTTPRTPRLGLATVEIEGIKNFLINRVLSQLTAESKFLKVDLIACFTRFPLAVKTDKGLRYDYFSQSAGPQDRFLFLSAADLLEYAGMANRTFEDSIVYLLTGELVDFFTDRGYHDATRDCLMDECGKRSDIVYGLETRKLCKQCLKAIKTPGLRAAVEALLAWRPEHPKRAA